MRSIKPLRIRKSFFQRSFLTTIYISALATWGLLVIDTARLAQEGTRLPITLPPSTTAPRPSSTRPASTSEAQETESSSVLALPADINLGVDGPRIADPQVVARHPKSGRYVSAWLPTSWSDSADARASFEANKDILDEISPFWYGVNSDGSLGVDLGGRDRDLVEIAHANDVLVIPTIHNISSYNTVTDILLDPRLRSQHVRFVVAEVIEYNYDGIDIDYESLDPSLRPAYSALIIELSQALRERGKLLTVAVHAKTSDYGGLGGYQDWALLNKYVDRVRIMTYDLSWSGGQPGPIAPLYWVAEVAVYAKTVIDADKIIIGVPFYGYNWPPEGRATAMTWRDIQALIDAYDGSVNLLRSDSCGLVEENWLVYHAPDVGRREVWYATSASLEAKLKLVQEMDLAGVAAWRLGNEDPANWEVIRDRLLQDPFEMERQITPYLPEH
jgi:spore germination protein